MFLPNRWLVSYQGRASDGRTPVLSQTDLNAQYTHTVGRDRRITVGLNVTNVFNQSRGISRYSVETDQGVQVDINEADYYAGKTHVGAAIDQQHLTRDPRFLQYDGFQEPIRARVTVRFTF